jgi:hypothetical protein
MHNSFLPGLRGDFSSYPFFEPVGRWMFPQRPFSCGSNMPGDIFREDRRQSPLNALLVQVGLRLINHRKALRAQGLSGRFASN